MQIAAQLTTLIVAVLVCVNLLGFALANRREPIALPFAGALAAMIIWMVASALELMSGSLEVRRFWADV